MDRDERIEEQIRQMFAEALGVEPDQVSVRQIMDLMNTPEETSPVVLGEPEATEYISEVVQAMYPTHTALCQ